METKETGKQNHEIGSTVAAELEEANDLSVSIQRLKQQRSSNDGNQKKIKTKKSQTRERSRCRIGRGKRALCKHRDAETTPKLKLWKPKKKEQKHHEMGSTAGAESKEATELFVNREKLKLRRS